MQDNQTRTRTRSFQVGTFAYLYLNRRARWYLTGISTIAELLPILRTAPAHEIKRRAR